MWEQGSKTELGLKVVGAGILRSGWVENIAASVVVVGGAVLVFLVHLEI